VAIPSFQFLRLATLPFLVFPPEFFAAPAFRDDGFYAPWWWARFFFGPMLFWDVFDLDPSELLPCDFSWLDRLPDLFYARGSFVGLAQFFSSFSYEPTRANVFFSPPCD